MWLPGDHPGTGSGLWTNSRRLSPVLGGGEGKISDVRARAGFPEVSQPLHRPRSPLRREEPPSLGPISWAASASRSAERTKSASPCPRWLRAPHRFRRRLLTRIAPASIRLDREPFALGPPTCTRIRSGSPPPCQKISPYLPGM